MASGFKVIVHEISSELSLPDFTNLFRKYGDVMTAYINTRTAYKGKVSGYVVYGNRKECVEAIAELNSKPPHYLNLQPTFSLDEISRFDDYQHNPPSPEHAAKFLRSPFPLELHVEKNESKCTVINYYDNEKQERTDGMRKIEPADKFSAKSGQTPEFKQLPDLGSGRKERTNYKQIRTTNFSEAQSEKDFNCKDDLNKTEKRATELKEECRNSSCIDIYENSSEKQSKSSQLDKRVVSNIDNNYSQSLTSAQGKYTPSITETISTIKGKAEKKDSETNGKFSDEKINEGKNGIVISKSSLDKVTAEDIKEANFKKDGSRATMKYSYLNSSRCSTWGLLSNNPKTQIVNYDLCTQQKKLSTDTFTEVVIYHQIGPGEYWVHCKNDHKNLKSISQSLFSKTTSGITCKPSVGEYFSVNLDKARYRCRVLSLEEPQALVQLIDFGISTECEVTSLSELPEMMKNYYAQAIHVKLDPWTPEKYLNLKKGDTLTLKAIEMVDEITRVQVDGILYSQITSFPETFVSNETAAIDKGNSDCKSTVKVTWPPFVLNFLKVGQEAACTVLKIKMNDDEQKDELIVAISSNDMSRSMDRLLSDFHKLCLELPEDHSFRPAVGKLIAAYYDACEQWVRAVVLSEGLNRWLVACCDFGVVLEVKKIQRMPVTDDFSEIPSFAARCKISFSWLPRDDLFSEEWIKENSTLWMKVCKKEDKYFKCQMGLVKDYPLCEVSVAIWVPQTDKPIFCKSSTKPERLRYASLSSGAVVRIVSYYMTLVMHVQPWNEESQQQIENIHDNINNLVEKSEPLKVAPVTGKMYICNFTQDMKYYRAVVNKVKNLEQISVTFVDYGNSEIVPLSNIYEISSELEEVPCFAVKIGLKRKFSRLLNKNAFFFLSYLTEGNEELLLVCPDGNLKSCDLLRRNGCLLSDILKELVDPSLEMKS